MGATGSLFKIWDWQAMWGSLLTAFCLMLVIEGSLPFLYPARWRRWVAVLANVDDKQLRIMGLISMLVGVGLLYVVRF